MILFFKKKVKLSVCVQMAFILLSITGISALSYYDKPFFGAKRVMPVLEESTDEAGWTTEQRGFVTDRLLPWVENYPIDFEPNMSLKDRALKLHHFNMELKKLSLLFLNIGIGVDTDTAGLMWLSISPIPASASDKALLARLERAIRRVYARTYYRGRKLVGALPQRADRVYATMESELMLPESKSRVKQDLVPKQIERPAFLD